MISGISAQVLFWNPGLFAQEEVIESDLVETMLKYKDVTMKRGLHAVQSSIVHK